MHVAVVTETYPPEVNGVAMTLGRMVQGLITRGHRVSLTRPRQQADIGAALATEPATTLVRGLPIPGYAGLRFGMPAARLFRRQWHADRPDVVQVVTEGPLGASAITAARQLGIPVVSEFHTNFHAYSRHYGFAWLEGIVAAHLRRLHNRGRMTLVPSHELGTQLLRRGYHGVRVVARGVDTAMFNPQRRSEALRSEWQAADRDLVVAHVGRLAAEKNLPLVFSTFAAIRGHVPGARLVLVGDGPERRRLEQQHPDHIFAGMRHGEDLAAHYASADLFLFPSLTETYGNVTLEALASGLPVVAYRMAAAAELIRDGVNGKLADPGASDQFERAALDLVTRPDTLRKAAAAAPASVAALDWDRIHDRLVAALREAMILPATPTLTGSKLHYLRP
ncbi:MAG: glycosyltransferase family 1 protein [Burkholderiaceae bacterium]|nr:glycosyltransferase family 1 protein [Burkholderiaceae bacterium]MCF8184109.1 glycosyltransferase family 1 protein [Polynucleobacter sp.]